MCVVVSVALLPVFIGCSNESTTGSDVSNSTSTANTESGEKAPAEAPISLEIADLEKINSWESQGKAHGKLTERMAEVMDSVSDESSANAAIEQFKTLASQFAAVNRAEKQNLESPSTDDKKLVFKYVGPANKKFDEAYTKLKEKEELFKMVEEALDKAYVGEEF